MHTVISQMYFYLSLTILLCPIQPRPATSLALATLILVGSEPTVAHDAASRGLAGSPRPADSRKLQKSKKKRTNQKKLYIQSLWILIFNSLFRLEWLAISTYFWSPCFSTGFIATIARRKSAIFVNSWLNFLCRYLYRGGRPSYAVMQTYAVNPPWRPTRVTIS